VNKNSVKWELCVQFLWQAALKKINPTIKYLQCYKIYTLPVKSFRSVRFFMF